MLGSALQIISDGDRHTAFLTVGYFNGHLSLIFTINFKTMAVQFFQNFSLTSSLTFKFAKADITVEPSSTLSMLEKFSFFTKSGCKSRYGYLHQKQLCFLQLKMLIVLVLHQAQQQGRESLAYWFEIGVETASRFIQYTKKMEFRDHQFICMVLDQDIE